MTDQHVTRVDHSGRKFVLVCSCGWRSAEKDTRAAARNASTIHRLNAAVQVL